MKTCPVCQKVLTDQAKFCYYCGASLLNAEADVVMPAGISEQPAVSDEAPVDFPEQLLPTVPETQPDSDVFVSAPDPIIPEPEPAPEPVIPEPEPEPVFETPVYEAPKQETPAAEPLATPVSESKAEPTVLATDSRSLMTTAGYIFTTLLFHVPLIGLIFMFIWGCGKTKNISLKRFSLAFLIIRLICYLLIVAATVFLVVSFSGVIQSLYDAVMPILFP